MHYSSAKTTWNTANWLAIGALIRFGKSRMRQNQTTPQLLNSRTIMSLADEILFRQLTLRNHLYQDPVIDDPAGQWAPVFILFQQTADMLHELHQQILELSPVAFAAVIPGIDLQQKAFRIGEDKPELYVRRFAVRLEQIIHDMSGIRDDLKTILRTEQNFYNK
jgi:hypothetical protein